MGKIKYELLPKQRSRKHSLIVNVDLYPYAQELCEELDRIGLVERVKHIPQLGVIKVPKKLAKTRYDYLMLQLYFHQVIKINLQGQLKLTYNNVISSKEFSDTYKYNQGITKPTIGDLLQLLTIVYNIGHFYNTFTASRATVMVASDNTAFKNMILNALPDTRYKEVTNKLIENKDYQHFHLLNSILMLDKCDKNKQSISLAIEILYAYINHCNYSPDDKLTYVFDIFRTVRTVSYIAYDLQISNTPIVIDFCNEGAMKIILKELLSEYNNVLSSKRLIESISKLLDDTVYNENSNAICYYKISRKMANLLSDKGQFNTEDYYTEYLTNPNSILNTAHSHRRDYVQKNILKLTFGKEQHFIAENLFSDLESINNTRVGYYDRYNGEKTILVSIKKKCDINQKRSTAFKVLKCVLKYLRKIDSISPHDVRFLLSTKFFLFYLFDENPVNIKQTIDKNICVICTRGKCQRINEIHSLLSGSIVGNTDQRHESEFMIKCLQNDNINDTSICIPASILVYQKDAVGKKMCEFDGLIIHPKRKTEQIVFLEAKNRKNDRSSAKRCLKEKLDKLQLRYDSNNITTINHDAFLKYTL